MWEIDDYCFKVPSSDKPIKEAPPLRLTWRAHLNSIVSVDLAEDKGLIITASTDCCVRMFTVNGRYIGIDSGVCMCVCVCIAIYVECMCMNVCVCVCMCVCVCVCEGGWEGCVCVGVTSILGKFYFTDRCTAL